MSELREILLLEQQRLKQIISKTQQQLQRAPEGRLRMSKSQGVKQFYHCTGEKKNGTYIPHTDMNLAKQLAQKSYDEKVLALAEKRFSQIARILKDYKEDEIEHIYLQEKIDRQQLIQPVEPTWEQRLSQWKQKEYIGKDFSEEIPVILTEKGERVRSKSEKIMADYFYRNDIDYKYECPLFLKGMGTVYPDFTFLSRKSGKEIYWEHCGKSDDPKYARSMVRKIQAYENNKIFPGERLILTYETEQTILNTGKIQQLVEKYLI